MAKDHDKKAESSLGRSHLDATVRAPIDLGAFSRCKRKLEKCSRARRPDPTDVFLENGISARISLIFKLLKNLDGGIRMLTQHAGDLLFKRVEFTWLRPIFSR